MKQKDVEFDIAIDPNQLDTEWCDQPSLYFQYAAKLASARRDVDEAKADLDVTRAELDKAIRLDPASFGLVKITEAAITSAIPTQEKFCDANEAVIEAKHRADILSAAVSALDHRKKALENLVSLFLSNYYSRPKASEKSKERMDDIEKQQVRSKGREKRGN